MAKLGPYLYNNSSMNMLNLAAQKSQSFTCPLYFGTMLVTKFTSWKKKYDDIVKKKS